jgi:hypothetical protein
MFIDHIQAKSNVFITAYDRGKKVPSMCRESHNIWVNLGREYLPRVISPASISSGGVVSGPVNPAWVQYFGFGIGGNKQTVYTEGLYPQLDAAYPGLNTYDKSTHETKYLERPVLVTGTAGTGLWAKQIVIPVSFPTQLSGVSSVVEFQATLLPTDIHLGGVYPAVPISEVGMMLSDQTVSQAINAVYDYGATPACIAEASRQRIVAYNNFAPITKTATIALEIRWQLQF